jgi:hypothetical protein
MTKKLDNNQILKKEAGAEYKKSLKPARRRAETLAKESAGSETKRVAAIQAGASLRKVEKSRPKIQQENSPETTPRTFWQWLTGE